MPSDPGAGEFRPTLWSVVIRARDASEADRRAALNRLCEVYWRPIYAYLRRKGFAPVEAEDATQGFFTHFLEKDLLDRVDPARGQFRSYLLAVLENFLSNEFRKERAEKRGGGSAPLSLDLRSAESGLSFNPADPGTPEGAFARAWGLTVLQNAFAALRADFENRGQAGHFEAVRAHLAAIADRPSYADLATRLGVSVTEITNLLHRSRQRLRELIRGHLRETVESESEVESEIRELFASI